MHQRDLSDETREFFQLSEKKQHALELYKEYSSFLSVSLFILALIIGSLWALWGETIVFIFGITIFAIGVFLDITFSFIYSVSGKEATKYYALKLHDEPHLKDYKQLQLWNKNIFDVSTEYYYPRIGELCEQASNHDNPEIYVHNRIADELRLIEHKEAENYNELINIEALEDYDLSEYEHKLFTEANYCYKFGGYTSTGILLRKISETLLVDILIRTGYYTELQSEWNFEEIVTVFLENVANTLPEKQQEQLEETLDRWMRKKGNKAAHTNKEMSREEVHELMDRSKHTLQLLLIIRKNVSE